MKEIENDTGADRDRDRERKRGRESVENNEQRNQHGQSFDIEMRIFSMK